MPSRVGGVSPIPLTYTPLPTVSNSLPYTQNTASGHQNTLPTTLTTSTTTDSQHNLQYASPEYPRLGKIFVTNTLGEYGNPIPDWKNIAIYYHARSLNSKPMGTPRANYGCVPPPVLHLEKELRISTYQL